MIYQLRGTPTVRLPGGFVLETATGVGYQVLCAPRTVDLFIAQQQAEVWIFTHMKDSVLCLYGFSTSQEREFFSELTTISGIGPKVTLLLLETLALTEILQAAAAEDHRPFQRVSGIGEKTARKLTLEVKHRLDKLQALLPATPTTPAATPPQQLEEVTSALCNMGFNEKLVRSALADFDWQGGDSTLVLVRQALQHLTRSSPYPAADTQP